MATRLYLRNSSPTNDPGTSTNSAVLPAHADNNVFLFTPNLLSLAIGASSTSFGGNGIATTNPQDNFMRNFSTEALAAQTITAQTWTIACGFAEGNGAANSFIALSVYVFREPSTVVGYVYDSDTALGNEWSGNARGRVATFSGAAVVASAGDYLVMEVWRHTPGQSMSTVYGQTLQFDGTTDVTEDQNGDFGSYLETPQNLDFGAAAAAVQDVIMGPGVLPFAR